MKRRGQRGSSSIDPSGIDNMHERERRESRRSADGASGEAKLLIVVVAAAAVDATADELQLQW